jgi:hypothetical protein
MGKTEDEDYASQDPNVNVASDLSAARLNLVFRRKDIRVIPLTANNNPHLLALSIFPLHLSVSLQPLQGQGQADAATPPTVHRGPSRCRFADQLQSQPLLRRRHVSLNALLLGRVRYFWPSASCPPHGFGPPRYAHSLKRSATPCVFLTRCRSSVLLTPLAAVHAAPLPLFHSPSRPQKHPPRPAHLLPLVHLPAHLIPLHPPHIVLPPPPSLRATYYRAPALPGASARQRPAVPVCGGAQMGITPLHAPRGDQHAVGHSGRRARRQGMGGRGGEGGRCGVEGYRRARCGCVGLLGRSRGSGHGEWHTLLLSIQRDQVQCPPEPGDRTDGTVSCRGHVRQTKR